MAIHKLDCKGLKCPIPIVRLSQAIRPLAVGEAIEIEADDPAFEADLGAWIRRFGHGVNLVIDGSVRRALITKK